MPARIYFTDGGHLDTVGVDHTGMCLRLLTADSKQVTATRDEPGLDLTGEWRLGVRRLLITGHAVMDLNNPGEQAGIIENFADNTALLMLIGAMELVREELCNVEEILETACVWARRMDRFARLVHGQMGVDRFEEYYYEEDTALAERIYWRGHDRLRGILRKLALASPHHHIIPKDKHNDGWFWSVVLVGGLGRSRQLAVYVGATVVLKVSVEPESSVDVCFQSIQRALMLIAAEHSLTAKDYHRLRRALPTYDIRHDLWIPPMCTNHGLTVFLPGHVHPIWENQTLAMASRIPNMSFGPTRLLADFLGDGLPVANAARLRQELAVSMESIVRYPEAMEYELRLVDTETETVPEVTLVHRSLNLQSYLPALQLRHKMSVDAFVSVFRHAPNVREMQSFFRRALNDSVVGMTVRLGNLQTITMTDSPQLADFLGMQLTFCAVVQTAMQFGGNGTFDQMFRSGPEEHRHLGFSVRQMRMYPRLILRIKVPFIETFVHDDKEWSVYFILQKMESGRLTAWEDLDCLDADSTIGDMLRLYVFLLLLAATNMHLGRRDMMKDYTLFRVPGVTRHAMMDLHGMRIDGFQGMNHANHNASALLDSIAVSAVLTPSGYKVSYLPDAVTLHRLIPVCWVNSMTPPVCHVTLTSRLRQFDARTMRCGLGERHSTRIRETMLVRAHDQVLKAVTFLQDLMGDYDHFHQGEFLLRFAGEGRFDPAVLVLDLSTLQPVWQKWAKIVALELEGEWVHVLSQLLLSMERAHLTMVSDAVLTNTVSSVPIFRPLHTDDVDTTTQRGVLFNLRPAAADNLNRLITRLRPRFDPTCDAFKIQLPQVCLSDNTETVHIRLPQHRHWMLEKLIIIALFNSCPCMPCKEMAMYPLVYSDQFFGAPRCRPSTMRTWREHLADPSSFEVLITDRSLLMRDLDSDIYDWEGFLQSYRLNTEFEGDERLLCSSVADILTPFATTAYYQANEHKRIYFTH